MEATIEKIVSKEKTDFGLWKCEVEASGKPYVIWAKEENFVTSLVGKKVSFTPEEKEFSGQPYTSMKNLKRLDKPTGSGVRGSHQGASGGGARHSTPEQLRATRVNTCIMQSSEIIKKMMELGWIQKPAPESSMPEMTVSEVWGRLYQSAVEMSNDKKEGEQHE